MRRETAQFAIRTNRPWAVFVLLLALCVNPMVADAGLIRCAAPLAPSSEGESEDSDETNQSGGTLFVESAARGSNGVRRLLFVPRAAKATARGLALRHPQFAGSVLAGCEHAQRNGLGTSLRC